MRTTDWWFSSRLSAVGDIGDFVVFHRPQGRWLWNGGRSPLSGSREAVRPVTTQFVASMFGSDFCVSDCQISADQPGLEFDAKCWSKGRREGVDRKISRMETEAEPFSDRDLEYSRESD